MFAAFTTWARIEGHTFFTMEYVDGEDLASLCGASAVCPKTKLSTLRANSARDWPPRTPKEFSIAI